MVELVRDSSWVNIHDFYKKNSVKIVIYLPLLLSNTLYLWPVGQVACTRYLASLGMNASVTINRIIVSVLTMHCTFTFPSCHSFPSTLSCGVVVVGPDQERPN